MGVRRHVVVIVVAVLVAACGGTAPSASTAGPTDIPVVSAAPSVPPATDAPASDAPSTDPSGPPSTPPPLPGSVIAPGTAVEVVAVELNLRRRPSTSAKVVSLLERGDVVVISPLDNLGFGWGPVRADGFDWYPVVQVSTPDGRLPALPERPVNPADGVPVSGWVAAGDGSRPFIRALPARCPATPNLRRVTGMLPAERMSCFGANPIVLEGTFGCGGCGAIVMGTFIPEWLATPVELDFLSFDPSVQFGPLALRFPPDGPERPPAGSIIRVTVHVHDSRSSSCSIVDGEGADAVTVNTETAELFCRERLVVDSFEILGTDPRFPGS